MSNASLKEQLQALTIGTAPASDSKPSRPKQSVQTTKSAAKQKPAWLEHAQYGVELLKVHFSACFKEIKEMQPLKVGIKQDLVKLLGTRDDIVIGDKACMVNSLAYYVNSPGYHKSMIAGATRIDLAGNAAGVVTPEEAQYSAECRKAKLQKTKSAVSA